MNLFKSKAITILIVFLFSTMFMSFAQEKTTKKETFTGYVRMISGPKPGASFRLTMTVDRWSTDEERKILIKSLYEGGSDTLLKELRAMEAGNVKFTGTLSRRLNFAVKKKTEKGLFVRMILDRPVFFAEYKYKMTRVRDYEFAIIEFTIDEKGKGEGIVIPTARVKINKDGRIKVETLGLGPQKLIRVRNK